MKACPTCNAVGTLGVRPIMVAAEHGTYSVAGQQDKVVARAAPELGCTACGWTVRGYLEDAVPSDDGTGFASGTFVVDQGLNDPEEN